MNAVALQNSKNIAGRKENIARLKKAKRPIAKLKTAAGTAKTNTNKKTWMMRLQHLGTHGI